MPDEKPEQTMREVGRRGGRATRDKMLAQDPEFYVKIGRKGGQRVRDLLAAGRKAEEQEPAGEAQENDNGG